MKRIYMLCVIVLVLFCGCSNTTDEQQIATNDTNPSVNISQPAITIPTEPGSTIPTIAPSVDQPEVCYHKYQATDTVAATCLKNGYISYTCEGCNHQYQVELPMLTHVYVGGNCTEPKVCSLCGTADDQINGHVLDEDYVCIACGYQQVSNGLEFQYNRYDNSYTVSGLGTCIDKVVIIPRTFKGVDVTAIGADAFSGSKIEKIHIPSSVSVIGNRAFKDCDNLKNISIPTTITELSSEVFLNCSGLESITLPSSIVTIYGSAFRGCTCLRSIIIPASTTTFYEGFQYCDNLVAISVERGNPVYHSEGNCIIETATKTLIAGCSASIIPSDGTVTSIGIGAFINNSILKTISIPNTITSIARYAFCGCIELTDITIPNSVTTIGEKAFSNCHNLHNIVVDKNNPVYHSEGNCIIETAKKTLIFGCATSVIPSDGSVTIIGPSAFEGFGNLRDMIIPASVHTIGNNAFKDCVNLNNIVISEGVSIIEDGAFSGCGKVKNLFIPASVNSIGAYAFSGCNLSTITVDLGNKVYHSNGNCVIKSKAKELVLGCANSIIPNDGTVSSIGMGAFNQCIGLTSIEIPDGVNSIGEASFTGCDNLSNITIPVSVKYIGKWAFYSCEKLQYITYHGTMDNWNMWIQSSLYYSYLDGNEIIVYCTDGEIHA